MNLFIKNHQPADGLKAIFFYLSLSRNTQSIMREILFVRENVDGYRYTEEEEEYRKREREKKKRVTHVRASGIYRGNFKKKMGKSNGTAVNRFPSLYSRS